MNILKGFKDETIDFLAANGDLSIMMDIYDKDQFDYLSCGVGQTINKRTGKELSITIVHSVKDEDRPLWEFKKFQVSEKTDDCIHVVMFRWAQRLHFDRLVEMKKV
jgi:hypothetical protein